MSTKRERERREVQMTKAKDWSNQEQGSGHFAYKIPEGMKRFKLVKGTNLFDIIPFIAGKGNPGADEGFGHFERQFSVHTIPSLGGKFDHFLCLWECYKESCDLCLRRRDRSCPQEEADILRAKLRHLMLVNDRPGDAKNPLKIFDATHYNRKLGFGEQLQLVVKAMRGGADFYYPKGGLTIQVIVDNEKYQQVTRIDLLPRDYDYSVDVMHDAPCLDDLLIKPQKSVIVQVLGLMNPEEEQQEESETESSSVEEDDPFTNPPSSRKEEKPTESEDDEDEETTPDKSSGSKREPTAKDKGFKVGTIVMFKKVECEIKKISEDGTSLSLMDEDGKKFLAIAPSECTKVPVADDDEDEPASVRNGRGPVKDEDDDDEVEPEDSSDLEDDGEEDEPAPKVKTKKTGK